jgi:hypothetical protein
LIEITIPRNTEATEIDDNQLYAYIKSNTVIHGLRFMLIVLLVRMPPWIGTYSRRYKSQIQYTPILPLHSPFHFCGEPQREEAADPWSDLHHRQILDRQTVIYQRIRQRLGG